MSKKQQIVTAILPWLCGIGMLILFCNQEYHKGLNFTHEIHAFMHLGKAFILGIILLGVAIGISIITATRFCHHENKTPMYCILICIWSSLLIAFPATPVMGHYFFMGRDKAYASLDYKSLYEQSINLCKTITSSDPQFFSNLPEYANLKLPKSIEDLNPMMVSLSSNGIDIHIDGGGIMYTEGLVILTPKAIKTHGKSIASKHFLTKLNDKYEIYFYRGDGGTDILRSMYYNEKDQ